MPTSAILSHWSLKDLLPDPLEQAVEMHLSQLETCVSDLESMRPVMTPQISETDFAKTLTLLETNNALIRRLQAYSFLWFSENTQNEAALNLRDRLDRSLTASVTGFCSSRSGLKICRRRLPKN